ncbi:RDD family protein [Desulfosporosinus meridiei]|uniref:Putative membrane protein/domain protein n=1 Tax=Desulfosporosinus meridiei (strain ATCC BAA-275 / DSM 13257 / KCTC 12902 / NCIMB 13706 / S10) TaxID=768704 RepID=J7IZ85_DESMD|nr:RDD family protein [Desulfosporosinus meridiei]AFQ44363.1 putative membrane protein/domain protein [Desulfosporosinus meridiei DSM 13257]
MSYSEVNRSNPQLLHTTNAKENKENHKRPWIRFWARLIDVILFMLIISTTIVIINPSALNHSAVLFWFLLFIWSFFEAVLLSTWGTTPGKWLLRIIIRDLNGEKLTFVNALKRSLIIWASGLGSGIVIILFITLIYQYNIISRNGTTSWDKSGKYTVTYTKIGLLRFLVAILIIFGFIGLCILGSK